MDQAKQSDKQVNIEQAIIQQKITKANGQTTIKKYSKGKALGRGGFAKCYEVTNLQTKRISAAKIIAKNSLNRSRAKQKLITEIKIHKSLNHQYIVKFQHVFEDHENVYILLEVCTNQTLNQLIKRRKRLTQIEVQYYLRQIVQSLIYLHQNKVIHRDLKLGNLFLNENMEIKLGDFGLASRLQYNEEKKKTICGTPNYIAPQILQGKGHSYEVDVWSVGVIIYTQLIGKPPFQTPEVKATYKKIKACSYVFPEHVTISENARNLISKILVLDPTKRPTLEEILTDPFMSEPIPKTMPRSTLACPPAKNFLDQFTKNSGTQASQQQLLSSKPSTANFEKAAKKDTVQKESASIKPIKETITAKVENNLLSTGANFRSSSKDVKLKAPLSNQPSSSKKEAKQIPHTQVHVKKWVDYSTKYGLGYLLSDGSTGVYFNDSTKIIMDKNGQNFEYIQKKQGQKADIITSYKLSNYPSERELQKKVTLLQHFRNYLYADTKVQPNKETPPQAAYSYVKKWMKTKHAIMFRLSNKIVQVNFTDKTEIILSSEQKLVTYINLKGQRSEHPLASALQSRNAEMAKRLKYTKQILTHMLNGTNVPATTGGQELD